MNLSTTFQHAYSAYCKVFQNSPEFRHVPKIKLNQAAFDIVLVAVGIRSGYLFDAFTLRNPRKSLKDFLAEVLVTVRQECQVFKNVAVFYDPASDQVFVVNVPMLRTYHDQSSKALSPALLTWVTFLELDGSKTKTSPPPPGLLKIFEGAIPSFLGEAEPPSLLHIPEDDTRTLGDMVGLAACLLEFPVAYVPISDGSGSFLAGVPLDVYECVLVQDIEPPPSEHVMLKFSCPQAMATDAPELRPEALVERLRARFTDRLEQVAFPGRLVVRHHVETKDRVAL